MIKEPKHAGISTQPVVLLAEDDHEMRTLISRALKKEGYEVREVADGVELVTHLGGTIENRQGQRRQLYDLVISDIRMPGVFGLSVLEGIQDMDDAPPMILITAFGDAETHKRAQELGAVAVLDKPFNMPDLMSLVRGVVLPEATSG